MKNISLNVSSSRVSLVDRFILALVGFSSFLIFINAGEDFSYDYIHYLDYFRLLEESQLSELIVGLWNMLPLPYVYIPPSGHFEVGFGALVWLLMQLFGSAPLSYAVIGSFSIMARIWILRNMDVHWGWIAVVNIYAITMFEANAIRLGCGFTLLLFGLLQMFRGKSSVHITTIFIMAGLFHLQTFLWSIFFLVTISGNGMIIATRLRLTLATALIFVLCIFAAGGIEQMGYGKLEDYAGVSSGSGGINFVSALGLLLWAVALGWLICMPREMYRLVLGNPRSRAWVATLVAGVPGLALYVFGTNIGAVGDRTWQVSFMMMAMLALTGDWRRRMGTIEVWLLVVLVLTATINVIYRYPLSNFFYPLTPYTEIDSSFF